jgi:hypothetical protein
MSEPSRQNIYTKKVIARIRSLGRGKAFTSKHFHDLASSDTVRQILGRLTAEGTIRRVARGVYEYPDRSALFKVSPAPDPDAIAQAVARSHGWTIFPTGEAALNRLGLSTQVPARWQYLSDGPTRILAWSGGTIVFKHRATKETKSLSPKTAMLVQALKSLGREHIDNAVAAALLRALTPREIARAAREARSATAWVYEVIKRLAVSKKPSDA